MIAAATTPEGTILRRARADTPLNRQEGLDRLHALAEEVRAGEPALAIGATAGGPLDWRTGIVSPLHQPEWREVPLKALYEAEYGCPFQVDVDTNAAALAEYLWGCPPDAPLPTRLLYLTLSTGMGGGFIIDGEIYRGGLGGAHPEAGHQSVPFRCERGDPAQVACECGAPDCLEALISGNGIRRIYGKPAEQLTSEEWSEVAFNLGLGLRNLAALYAPDIIVIGGGVAVGGGDRLIQQADAVLHERLRLVPVPPLRLSALGYETALSGAVALALNALRG